MFIDPRLRDFVRWSEQQERTLLVQEEVFVPSSDHRPRTAINTATHASTIPMSAMTAQAIRNPPRPGQPDERISATAQRSPTFGLAVLHFVIPDRRVRNPDFGYF